MTILNLEIRKEILLLALLTTALTIFSVLTATGFDIVENANATLGWCWMNVCVF